MLWLRSSPTTKRAIESPTQSKENHVIDGVFTQPGPKADVNVSFLNSRLRGAKFAYIGHLRLVRFRIPDRDASEREVEMFISQKDGRMSRILSIGAPNPGRPKGGVIARVSSSACWI